MRNLIVRLFINAVGLLLAARIVPGIELSEEFWPVVLVALIFGLVNALIKPFAMLLSLPLLIVTVGLFTLVINALMLMLTAALTRHLDVSGFWSAFLGSLLISIVSIVMSSILRDRPRHAGR